MGQIKLSYDASGPCLLELPPGLGQTISIFSLTLAYMAEHPNAGPFVYCVNSVNAADQALKNLKIVHNARLQMAPTEFDTEFKASAFLPKTTACINPKITNNIPLECTKMTFPWSEEICPFYENTPPTLPNQVLDVQETIQFCKENGCCPYFTMRRLCQQCKVIICSVEDLIHPREGAFLRDLLPITSIIAFDDINTIDDICCSSMSYYLNKDILNRAAKAFKSIKDIFKRSQEREAEKLNEAYLKLKEGLHINDVEQMSPKNTNVFIHPVLREHQSHRYIPGSLRKPEIFFSKIHNLLHYFNDIFKKTDNEKYTSTQMLSEITEKIFIEPEMLHFMTTRLSYLFINECLTDLTNYIYLFSFLDFLAVLSTYEDNISIIYDVVNPNYTDDVTKCKSEDYKTLQLKCLDASLAFSQILQFKRIVLAGECISPLTIYSQILNFEPISMVNYSITNYRSIHLPLIISRGTDQIKLTSTISLNKNLNGVNNYGKLIVELCKVVPDGIIGYFPSMPFLQEIIGFWNKFGILQTILDYKLLFIETLDRKKSSLIVDDFKHAIDNGYGAVLFAVADGNITKSTQFPGAYGRACVLFGFPEPQNIDLSVNRRAEFLDQKFQIPKEEFHLFNSMRIASHCTSGLLCSKEDYTMIVFADMKYKEVADDARSVMPTWISNNMKQINQSVDDSIDQAKNFFLAMSQKRQEVHNKNIE
ncbi:DNA repair helicase XPD [Histomonas meleagridis]|uniref:DNA repair helicase XPD n=1 Tax=Histomonas meleagridis TaxID=135588 RepID=UPI00355AB4AF|nr:DNA repair helicase XPD [Histomonas meleagridis]KAH0796949.1 DNA repair helicase XPD [Histomonas meleagridis]